MLVFYGAGYKCLYACNCTGGCCEVEGLTQAINALSKDVSPTDASQTSSLLINTAIELADEYDMASPGITMLVHMGYT